MTHKLLQQSCASELQLVMFDLDGTLVNSLPDLHAATNAMLTDLGQQAASGQEVEHWVGNGARVLVARALSRHRQPDPNLPEAEIDAALALFKQHYRKLNGQHSQCYPGAVALLAELGQAGIHRAIVTNKPMEFTRTLCSALSLQADLLVAGDSLPEMKPSPLPLLHCCETFQVPPENSIMVGDSINDLAAAKSAGVNAIAVSYGYNHGQPLRPEDAVCIIDSLEELR